MLILEGLISGKPEKDLQNCSQRLQSEKFSSAGQAG
jgi:hypothetical protein